ncbi:MAG: transaldolase [Deltaproteobacteria bacterium]|nr:transaldolase [Deltaproteobacteria bacterium]
MSVTTIEQLGKLGQSVWFDYISRSLMKSGRLKALIDLGVTGMTSNPTIFDQAINSGDEYDEQIGELHRQGKSTFEIYDEVTVRDIQEATDTFRPIYERTEGLDGYVSLEINPKLAYNTQETIDEGTRLVAKMNRPNVMFKVPATDDGYEAITALLAEGINVNVTLIFSLKQYQKTAAAYLEGVTKLLQKGGDARQVRSVASVFVSRVDTSVDKLLDQLPDKKEAASLRGKAAVANANLIYSEYARIFAEDEFKRLEQQGASVQRVLWGSTGTKNPDYSDIKYVTELIAKDTVNTVPEKTLEAFLDHGVVKETLTAKADEAQTIIDALQRLGIDINAVCAKLLEDGVVAFEKSFDSLLDAIEKKTRSM